MNSSDWKQEQERFGRERVEWARGTPEERRKIYKRQWMRRYRKKRKAPYRDGVTVYFPKGMIERVEKLRPKGVGRSAVIIQLVGIALDALGPQAS